MTPDDKSSEALRLRELARRVTLALGLISGAIALVIVAGWLIGQPALTRIGTTQPSVKFNTALALLCLGLGMCWRVGGWRTGRLPLDHLLIAGSGVLALATGAQYLLGADLQIDQLFVADAGDSATVDPGRMAPNTTVIVGLIALALELRPRRSRALAVLGELAGILACIIVFSAVTGYVLQLASLGGAIEYTRMALPTAVMLLLIAIGSMAFPADRGLARVVVSPGAGGHLARVALPLAAVAPLAFGRLRLELQSAGIVSLEAGAQLMVLAIVFAAALTALLAARRLNSFDAQLRVVNGQLERSIQSKNEFLSSTSHELRTPLAAIRNLSETLILHWDSIPDDNKRTHLQTVAGQASRLLRLVSDLLTVSRVESGTITRSAKAVNLRAIVDEVIDEIDAPETQISGAADLQVLVDPDHLKQMLINYVANAVKYGQSPREVSATRTGALVTVTVSDTGPGVPDELSKRLFELFVKGEVSTGGTGLGLWIVKGLAVAYGGDAWYEPNAPHGSRFVFCLPAA